jgi:hypothetical protein
MHVSYWLARTAHAHINHTITQHTYVLRAAPSLSLSSYLPRPNKVARPFPPISPSAGPAPLSTSTNSRSAQSRNLSTPKHLQSSHSAIQAWEECFLASPVQPPSIGPKSARFLSPKDFHLPTLPPYPPRRARHVNRLSPASAWATPSPTQLPLSQRRPRAHWPLATLLSAPSCAPGLPLSSPS